MTNWRKDLLEADRIAFDIEIRDSETLLCCGFSAHPSKAYVFPAHQRDIIEEILLSDVPKLAQNAPFDLYWLQTRWNLRVNNTLDDTMLAWHSCHPELAGKSDQKSYKTSRKSLAFLASMFTLDAYWKDYDTDDAGMYELNGHDCCITLEIMDRLDEEIDELGVRSVYEHAMSLVPVVVDMQARGLKVDEAKRRKRVQQLRGRFDELQSEINEICLPIIEEHRERLEGVWHLFEQTWTCPCCRNGSTKRDQCYSCAGFESAPNKSDVVAKFGNPNGLNKDALFSEVFEPCKVCDGEGQRTWLEVNPRSDDQMKAIVYDALKLPKRYNNGNLSVNEDSLKSILATL